MHELMWEYGHVRAMLQESFKRWNWEKGNHLVACKLTKQPVCRGHYPFVLLARGEGDAAAPSSVGPGLLGQGGGRTQRPGRGALLRQEAPKPRDAGYCGG